MKNPRADDDLLPEYDFSAASRGRHRGRFQPDDPWVEQAVQEDEARWLVEGLLQVQRLERALVAWFALVEGEELAVAGERTVGLLELLDPESFRRLAAGLASREDFAERLRDLVEQRNWLVHGSFLRTEEPPTTPRAGRLRQLAEQAEELADEVMRLLRDRVVGSRMTPDDFDERLAAIHRAWPGSRAA